MSQSQRTGMSTSHDTYDDQDTFANETYDQSQSHGGGDQSQYEDQSQYTEGYGDQQHGQGESFYGGDQSQYSHEQDQSFYSQSEAGTEYTGYNDQDGTTSAYNTADYTDDEQPIPGETYYDEDGEPYYYDEDGNPYRVDENGERYYNDDQPYAENPYVPSNDTGAAMMSYEEPPPEDYDDEYDEDEEGYEEREGVPLNMPGDYYAGDEYPDDYYDEDEEERLRRARRRRAWCCCLILLCCLLILIILLIIFLLTLREDNDTITTDPPTFAPFVDDTDDDFYFDDDIEIAPGVVTSCMAPHDLDCDYGNHQCFANVWDQCLCDNEITVVPDDVAWMRQLIIDKLFAKVYPDKNMTNTTDIFPINECTPANMALIWLASGDNRDSGEIRQRFALGLFYFGMNGTIWDYGDAWMSDLNECLWLGVQCNNRDAVNSLAVDTNNVFGPVSFLHMSLS